MLRRAQLLALLLLTSACSPPTGLWNEGGALNTSSNTAAPTDTPPPSDEETELSSDVSVAGYQQTLYPIVRQNCIACHATGQTPFFAAPDPQEAHDSLLGAGKINFDLIENSRLVNRLRVDKHNCWSGDCEADATTAQNAIHSWLTLRGASDNRRPALVSSEINVPSSVPLVTTANPTPTPTVLQFSVANLFSPPLTGATAEISIVRFDDYSYKITKPVLKTPTVQSIYVKSLSVLLNGIALPQNATYTRLDGVFSPSPTGATLSTAAMVLEKGNGTPDKLSLGFEELNIGSGPALALQRFQSVRNLIQTSCISCHGIGVTGRPVLAGLITEEDYKAFTWMGEKLVVRGNLTSSLLYKVLNGSAGVTIMPTGANATTRAPMKETVRAWITEMP